MNSFLSKEEIIEYGFQDVGSNVLISRKASIYGAGYISIGNNVRIDDFCIISGRVSIGNNTHIAAYSAIYGGDVGVSIADFANVSSRVCIYAISDDYSGKTMTNPMIPDKYKNIVREPVTISKHVIIGSGTTILPGVLLEEGTAIGAMSLVKESTDKWGIYAGIPAKKIKERSKELLALEREYLNENK